MYEQEKWELRAATARRFGLGSVDDVELALIKPFARRTGPVTQRRRQALRARLVGLLSKAGGEGVSSRRVDADAGATQVEAVCRTCRGHCCRDGGDHAYLTAFDLRRGGGEAAEGHAEAVAELYLSFVPRRAYKGSCIFHSATGCALPARLRSRTCTEFFCGPMKALLAQRKKPPGATAVVLTAPPGPHRIVIRRAPTT